MRMDSASVELERLARNKQNGPFSTEMLGPQMLGFFKNTVQKRHTRLSAISEKWALLVPDYLLQHCALEGFSAGTLKVIVDSSSHLYELRQLLLAGLSAQLLIACKSSGLRKVTLKFGRWYKGDGIDRKISF